MKKKPVGVDAVRPFTAALCGGRGGIRMGGVHVSALTNQVSV